MRTRTMHVMLCIYFVLMAVFMLPIQAHADTGPKPSVRITFTGMEDTLCYGTLLSEADSTGPASAWDGVEEYARYDKDGSSNGWLPDYEIWKAFVDYNDSDGYYFLQESWCVSEKGELNWTYYPPSPFKILLYWPETGTYAVSGIQERYAFDSYFTVDMTDFSVTEGETRLPDVVKSYPWGKEILMFTARVVLTVLLEMAAARLFRFRYQKEYLILLVVNLATQLFLNITLQITNPGMGGLMFFLTYAFLESIIVIAEAAAYSILLPKATDDPPEKWVCILYAVIANALSFFGGLLLAEILPGLF